MTRLGVYICAIAMVVIAGCSPQFSLSNDAANGDVAGVQRDLANKVDPNTKVANEPVLQYAAANGHLDIVQILLQAGADAKARDDETGDTVLIAAADSGHGELIKPLVAAGADLTVRNRMGHTPLIEAIVLKEPDMVQALIDAGADVNEEFSPGDGHTLLAMYKDNPDYSSVTPVLIRNGAHE